MSIPPPWSETIHFPITKGACLNTILKEGKLDWKVSKNDLRSVTGAIMTEHFSLERNDIKKVLDVVGRHYYPVQNIEAIERFMAICEEGYMTITHVGHMGEGRRIWVLAKMAQSFTFGEDEVQGHVLMSHSHEYGKGTNFYVMPLNTNLSSTIVLPIGGSAGGRGRIVHTQRYDADDNKFSIKETFDLCKQEMKQFQSFAEDLVKSAATPEEIREFAMVTFYPKISDRSVLKEMAQKFVDVTRQPPAPKLWDNTWWYVFNCFCYFVDHKMGNDRGFGLESAWFGPRAVEKRKVFESISEYWKVQNKI